MSTACAVPLLRGAEGCVYAQLKVMNMNALAKKLLIKPGTSWLFYDVPPECMVLLQPLPDGVSAITEIRPSINGILFFSTKRAQLIAQLERLTPVIKDDTVVWVCYPKKGAGIDTDLAMMQWDMLPPFGLDAVANAAFDDKWTCVRLRLLGQRKKTGVGIAEIRENEYGKYIDVDKKTVTLPPDVQAALHAEPAAFAVYEKLAYSHRKEYIMWIVGAKQQKTRDDRMVKMVDMLVNGKKNPGDK